MNISSVRLVPQLERSPKWVAFAQTLPGKLCLVGSFAALLFLHDLYLWWLFSLYLLTFSLWPRYRWKILFAATWSFLLLGTSSFDWERINLLFREAGIHWQINNAREGLPLILSVIFFSSTMVWLARRSVLSGYLKRPILSLILLNLGLMVTASYLPMPPEVRAFLWVFLVILGKYFWYICYSLKECRAPSPAPLAQQFGHYLPFWAPHITPYPKGSGYLKKIEAKTAEEFAICQIKGLKLLLWALWLKLFAVVINITFYGYGELLQDRLQFKREFGTVQLFFDGNYLHDLFAVPFTAVLPRYEFALNMAMSGAPLPWHTNWAVLVVNFLYDMLSLAMVGHMIISVVRMCGFNALRNTYRPLASKSIAEFWNRFFYYFKELLVDFFFYPVFFRYFKNRPILRMYTATMAAAFLGNFLFHFMRDIHYIIKLGFFQSIAAFHCYFIYTFVLGNAIFFSQWRQEKISQREAGPISRFLAPIRVLGFYCLLMIFVDFRRESISDNLSFLLSLLPF